MITKILVSKGDNSEIMYDIFLLLKEIRAPIEINMISMGTELYDKKIIDGIYQDSWEIIRNIPIILRGYNKKPKYPFKDLKLLLLKKLGLFLSIYKTIENNPITVFKDNTDIIFYGVHYKRSCCVTDYIKSKNHKKQFMIISSIIDYMKNSNINEVTICNNLHNKLIEILKNYKDLKVYRYKTKEMCSPILVTNRTNALKQDKILNIYTARADIGVKYAVFTPINNKFESLLQATIMLLEHLKESNLATLLQNTFLFTKENNQTMNIKNIMKNIGKNPNQPIDIKNNSLELINSYNVNVSENVSDKILIGVDITIDLKHQHISNILKQILEKVYNICSLRLIIYNNSIVWSEISSTLNILTEDESCIFLLRFSDSNIGSVLSKEKVIILLKELYKLNLDIVKLDSLYSMNNIPSFYTL
jgi:hypothetical protein